jgi:hypothetical protein
MENLRGRARPARNERAGEHQHRPSHACLRTPCRSRGVNLSRAATMRWRRSCGKLAAVHIGVTA